jgi:hypothetical protein
LLDQGTGVVPESQSKDNDMADVYGVGIRNLEQRLDKLERLLQERGIIPSPPAPPVSAVPPTVDCVVTDAFRPTRNGAITAVIKFKCLSCGKEHEGIQVYVSNFGLAIIKCPVCSQSLSVNVQQPLTRGGI